MFPPSVGWLTRNRPDTHCTGGLISGLVCPSSPSRKEKKNTVGQKRTDKGKREMPSWQKPDGGMPKRVGKMANEDLDPHRCQNTHGKRTIMMAETGRAGQSNVAHLPLAQNGGHSHTVLRHSQPPFSFFPPPSPLAARVDEERNGKKRWH